MSTSQPQKQSLLFSASSDSLQVLARVLGVFFSLFFVSLFILPWFQTVDGKGKVVAFSPTDRQQRIVAPIESRIKEWFVLEGTRVKKGTPIVELTDNDPEILTRLKTERDALDRRVQASKLGIENAKRNLERQKNLFEEGLSSRRQFEQANLELVKYLTDEANAVAELARIDVRLARQTAQMVTAPVDGTILRRVSGQEGELLKAGDPIAIIVPDTESRAVEFWIRGNDMPLVQPGQKVRLQFEGWPAIQFSGWPSVAVGTFGGVVSLVDPADNGQGFFRVLVVPDGMESWPSHQYLRQGVRALGWILIKTVPVGYELWRQFNAFPIAPPSETLVNDAISVDRTKDQIPNDLGNGENSEKK